MMNKCKKAQNASFLTPPSTKKTNKQISYLNN